MRRSRTSMVGTMACVLGLLLAACGGADTARQTFPRSTVPATADLKGATDPTNGGGPVTGDEAFLAKNIRLVDPCGLLDQDTLAAFGTPANSRLRDFDLCSNYMKDAAGKELNFTLTIGESVTGSRAEGSFKLGGLPASESELDDKTACFINVMTESSPKRAIALQVGGAGGLCEPGRKLMEAVVKKVRDGAPQLKLAKGTMVNLEACEILDESVITATLGSAVQGRPTELHACDWDGDGVNFTLGFDLGPDPKELTEAAETTAVDLGGVTAYKDHDKGSGDSCRLQWAHAPYPGDRELAEVVTVEYDRYDDKSGDDTCAKAEAAAKALIPKLPTG